MEKVNPLVVSAGLSCLTSLSRAVCLIWKQNLLLSSFCGQSLIFEERALGHGLGRLLSVKSDVQHNP
jgi:hypothetical protein